MTSFRVALPRVLLGMLFALAGVAVQAQPERAKSRGDLLYSTHCIECHSTQMHWRDNKQARDWTTLLAQVRRWQSTAGLGWSEADVAEVAGHLNDTIYHYPQLSPRASRD